MIYDFFLFEFSKTFTLTYIFLKLHISSQPSLPKIAALLLQKPCYATMLTLVARDATWQSCRKIGEYT